MAGIAGYISQELSDGSFAGALASLCHHPSHRSRMTTQQPGLQLGCVFRHASPPKTFADPVTGVTVVMVGLPVLKRGEWREATPQVVAERYLELGRQSLFELDGSFLLAVADARSRSLLLLTDRLASMPLVYWSGEGEFAFAPEAKAIFLMTSAKPRLDIASVSAFLNLGYPIGHRTMFEGISYLEAGHLLTVDVRSGQHRCERYWDLKFLEAEGPRSADDAANELDAILTEALRATLADAPQKACLLLTGGWDSRAMLGVMVREGHAPPSTVTWGVSDDIPESDTCIARDLAALAGVPNQTVSYGPDDFVRNASEWVRISELASDNAGSFAAGADFLDREAGGVEVVFTGDQAFGAGGLASTRNEAMENLTKVPVNDVIPALAEVSTPDGRSSFASLFQGQLNRVADGAASATPKDLQDYLFLHIYVSRWLCAPAYFREPMVDVRRPMLMGNVLEFIGRLPGWLRADKRVLIEFLKRKFPHLLQLPKASANSLVDWNFESRQDTGLREFLEARLTWEAVEATPVAAMLDRAAYRKTVTEFFQEAPSRMNRSPTRVPRIYALRRILSKDERLRSLARRVEPLAKRLLKVKSHSSRTQFLMRIALINSLQRQIDEGEFGPRQENETAFSAEAAATAAEGELGRRA